MDESVLRAMLKWPDVPAVYGWLALERRGNWLIKKEKIGNAALRDFISRNYQADDAGRWYFQNGPQRVYVQLAYTPLVVRFDQGTLTDHCGSLFHSDGVLLDDEGSILMSGSRGVGLLDDRDLEKYAAQLGEAVDALPRIARADVAARFGFISDPKP